MRTLTRRPAATSKRARPNTPRLPRTGLPRGGGGAVPVTAAAPGPSLKVSRPFLLRRMRLLRRSTTAVGRVVSGAGAPLEDVPPTAPPGAGEVGVGLGAG